MYSSDFVKMQMIFDIMVYLLQISQLTVCNQPLHL